MAISKRQIRTATQVLRDGGVAVIPTDTIYGIVGSALDPNIVGRIAGLRRRSIQKPMIVLIADMGELSHFGIAPGPKQKRLLGGFWPGKVSVILGLPRGRISRFSYLHRSTGTVAFRVPKLKWLRELLKTTGPLVAPSANFEGEPPSMTVRDAKKYFGNNVDYYLDTGRRAGRPSMLIKFEGNAIVVMRK